MHRKLLPIIISAALVSVLAGSILVMNFTALSANSAWAGASARAGVSVADNQGGQLASGGSPMAPVGSGFTYQGALNDGSIPANGQYDLTFALYDTLTAGNQVGSTITLTNQTVTNGLFTVNLDFGVSSGAFWGSARWLQIAVRTAGVGNYSTLSPRQALTAAPYALSIMPGAVITATTPSNPTLTLINTGTGLSATGDTRGAYGYSASGRGVYGQSSSGDGVFGVTTSGDGVSGQSSGGRGVSGLSTDNNGYGVYGEDNIGQYSAGVYGASTNGYGVYGISDSRGVQGVGGAGVYGSPNILDGYGVYGTSFSGYAIYGSSPAGWAGYFDGDVHISGSCCGAAAGSVTIDHPLDPANKDLSQAIVASPDLKTIYDGLAVLDAKGEAWVELPSYVEALNRDFRYQFAPIGAPMPNLYIAEKVKNNRFKIAGGKAGMEVSWQVTGIRKDPYAQAHPIQVEAAKKPEEQGKYHYPEEYGQPESLGVDYERTHALDKPLPDSHTVEQGAKP